ncbi:acyltransferase [Corynebacterium sanguinis]|uniref:Acyltransferase n=2 Tax=Corynebacterium TaxID=1716 RepID=C0XNT9_CORLD|nr:acyltransferase [Corynebacterium lipophiloflavum DSM 44291]MCT2023294.1 acyltransferase [Corynebacterium sanguinis]MCT2046969.1 acyltransferase [Corynebacterium sanguinis]
MRAVAALGIVVTHVAFQTATYHPVLERFDYFVAVFYALSAFLLTRGGQRPGYYRRRLARLAPAYLVCVAVVLATLPELAHISPPQVLAQVFMVQIYLPDGLVAGLTQIWSLCVEVAFYLVLPLYLRLSTPHRTLTLAVTIPLSLAWPWAIAGVTAVNMQIWPPSYVLWFAVGLILAELERIGVSYRGPRLPFALVALPVAWFAGVVGPAGLEHPSPAEFNARVILGALFAALVVAPFALSPREDGVLASSAMRRLGRWSYSIFLWHVWVLSFAFPLLGVPVFGGHFAAVLVFTVAFSVAVSYVSYELVEVPGARWVTSRFHRNSDTPNLVRVSVEPAHS